MISIQRLNMDNSWLLEMDNQKLLIDPWLVGEEVDYFRWFNRQWHRYPPIAIDELPDYDAVIITQQYPDHFHAETLALLKPDVVIAPRSIQQKLEKTLPDANVTYMNRNNPFIRLGGLEIHWFESTKPLGPAFNAVAVSNGKETVLLATHGFAFNDAQLDLLRKLPKLELLFTPINEYRLPFFLGGSIAPGLKGLENMVKITGAVKFVSTHDEEKHASGIVPLLAKIGFKTKDKIRNIPFLAERFLDVEGYGKMEITNP